MLDGVDEVPTQNRELLRDEIKAIVEAYQDCYFVLTSRPTAIPEDWLNEFGFINADVSPMSMPDVERFVKRWHEATGKELARQGRADANLATVAERLVEQFNQNPPLSLLATNPLLCAMICALHRVRHHKLPESQYELCETLCHMLLHKRERESHLNWQEFPAACIALTYEQKRWIAQQLAQWLVHNGQSAMPLEVAYEQVARALQRIPGRTPDEAPLILKTLVERSGLLREPNPDVVDFLHNTFKELLAGDDLAVRGDAESVVQHFDDESWRRMALFGVASPRSQTFADALVTRVLAHIRRMGIPARPASTLKSPNAKRTKAQTGKDAHPTDLRLSTLIAGGSQDLGATKEDALFFDVLGLFVLHFPLWWCTPIRFALLIVSTQLYGRHVLRFAVLKRSLLIWLTMLIIVTSAPVVGWIVSACIRSTVILPRPFVWYGHGLSFAMWCLSVLMVLSIGHWMLRRIDERVVWDAFWLGQAMACMIVSIWVPEFSHLFSVPGGIALLLTLAVRSIPLRTLLGTACAGIILIPMQHLLSIALGPAAGLLLFPTFALIALPMLPAMGKRESVTQSK